MPGGDGTGSVGMGVTIWLIKCLSKETEYLAV